MRSRKPFLIFWPQYFDLKRSRGDGRRLPKNLAIEKVTPEDIAKAARRLGYVAQIEKGYKYPRTWWDSPGRVLVETRGKKKSKVLYELAKEIRKMRTKR
ncbi:MAG: signal recognition particle subunit SRP19/SEC65 family protein [Promethearchaeota archaeon]